MSPTAQAVPVSESASTTPRTRPEKVAPAAAVTIAIAMMAPIFTPLPLVTPPDGATRSRASPGET
jgi:hypothetical protein